MMVCDGNCKIKEVLHRLLYGTYFKKAIKFTFLAAMVAASKLIKHNGLFIKML